MYRARFFGYSNTSIQDVVHREESILENVTNFIKSEKLLENFKNIGCKVLKISKSRNNRVLN